MKYEYYIYNFNEQKNRKLDKDKRCVRQNFNKQYVQKLIYIILLKEHQIILWGNVGSIINTLNDSLNIQDAQMHIIICICFT